MFIYWLRFSNYISYLPMELNHFDNDRLISSNHSKYAIMIRNWFRKEKTPEYIVYRMYCCGLFSALIADRYAKIYRYRSHRYCPDDTVSSTHTSPCFSKCDHIHDTELIIIENHDMMLYLWVTCCKEISVSWLLSWWWLRYVFCSLAYDTRNSLTIYWINWRYFDDLL